MASLEEIREARLAKIKKLEDAGINPYPISSSRTHTLASVRDSFEEGKEVVAVGRIMAIRGQGGLLFVDLYDGTDSFQALFKKDEMDEKLFDLFSDTSDMGDFIEVSGSLFTTKRGEQSVEVKNWKMLSKSLRPLPEKWHGLKDAEERYRRRYLDILSNEDVRQRFLVRSGIVRELRNVLHESGYVEVETPMLQPLAGGASARPFVTHHNALDIDLFLRVAPELYLKRILVAGMPKVFELNRNFRNEGIDVTHNPEFTMLEYYEAYSDKDEQMAFITKLLREVAERVLGGQTFIFEENEIDLSVDFKHTTFSDLFKEHLNIENITEMGREELVEEAREHSIDVDEKDGPEKIMDSLYKKQIRPKLIQPIFITSYPVNYLPLAKKLDENTVDAFQLVVGGIELVKAFSELNDPVDQRERFEAQEKERERGDEEAQQLDVDFIEAMEHGMPPAGGVGIGVDRLVMLFTNVHNIREVILFPTLKPKE